jgi:hypothetical protein
VVWVVPGDGVPPGLLSFAPDEPDDESPRAVAPSHAIEAKTITSIAANSRLGTTNGFL